MNYDHVIWDFDGTLFDTYPVMAQAFRQLARERGIDESREEIMKQMQVSMGHALSLYKEKYHIDDAFIKQFKKLSITKQEKEVKPFEHIVDICKKIQAHGAKNHLYTHRGESAFYFMEKFGLAEVFSEMITSKDNFSRKPSPDALLFIAGKYNVELSRAIMIGDRELDILSAKNAGMRACFFAGEGAICEHADYTINSLQKLNGILGI